MIIYKSKRNYAKNKTLPRTMRYAYVQYWKWHYRWEEVAYKLMRDLNKSEKHTAQLYPVRRKSGWSTTFITLTYGMEQSTSIIKKKPVLPTYGRTDVYEGDNISTDDLQAALKQMKNTKAVSTDGINVKCLKYGGQCLEFHLLSLINEC